MKLVDRLSAIKTINQLATEKIPFLFIASFDTSQNLVIPLSEIDPLELAYDFNGQADNIAAFSERYQLQNADLNDVAPSWLRTPVSFETYNASFQKLLTHLKNEEIRLANLTFPTKIACNLTFPEIFARTKAKYRIFFKDHFCAFSPETFITIKAGVIATYPMKGTINAGIENAEQRLLNDPKEIDEHETVAQEAVADISLVANDAKITKFRYVDRVHKGDGTILQTSSIIEGTLPPHYLESLGDIIYKLLPAGSITGAPRARATQILAELEIYDRGFYSGVAGIFDGENLDSTVLIRYLEHNDKDDTTHSNRPAQDCEDAKILKESAEAAPLKMIPLSADEILFRYTFKSGGGITAMSNAKSEYDELIEKIYLPIS